VSKKLIDINAYGCGSALIIPLFVSPFLEHGATCLTIL
jgi:hypothetical protein